MADKFYYFVAYHGEDGCTGNGQVVLPDMVGSMEDIVFMEERIKKALKKIGRAHV